MRRIMQRQDDFCFLSGRQRQNECPFRLSKFHAILTRYSDFKGKLTSLSLVTNERRDYGKENTVQQRILNCPAFELQKVAPKEIIDERMWSKTAKDLISSAECFFFFDDFRKETLFIKDNLDSSLRRSRRNCSSVGVLGFSGPVHSVIEWMI
uniref:Uncharacterized protein n=1 Tax=Vespula pensylvanica TaxID=30213 RepID=A0A834JZA2_VESPE|nr:hypothetical protein H0235_016713 [Vespula pensylvanica]